MNPDESGIRTGSVVLSATDALVPSEFTGETQKVVAVTVNHKVITI
ncbi:hypothetical protein MGSAQ_000248 [marine sediment metagenome]|uniref:Uncharacterized protein n=1 Tax=marine sediment metagenome TaxID=412755 RepID=A0A1B6NXX2_9ZZZZ